MPKTEKSLSTHFLISTQIPSFSLMYSEYWDVIKQLQRLGFVCPRQPIPQFMSVVSFDGLVRCNSTCHILKVNLSSKHNAFADGVISVTCRLLYIPNTLCCMHSLQRPRIVCALKLLFSTKNNMNKSYTSLCNTNNLYYTWFSITFGTHIACVSVWISIFWVQSSSNQPQIWPLFAPINLFTLPILMQF